MSRRAVVLLSGGLDSATTLYAARRQGFELHALSVAYGQRHAGELEAARRIARAAGVADHRVAPLDLRLFGGSALTGAIEVPKDREPWAAGHEIPLTYVPARNTIFLALALAWAEVLGSADIFIGVNRVDYSGYPDCRPEFLRAFEQLAGLATAAGVAGTRYTIHAPLLELDKAAIVRLALELGVDVVATRSCYDPDAEGLACGRCDSCRLRLQGFARAGLEDPALYRKDAPRPDREARA